MLDAPSSPGNVTWSAFPRHAQAISSITPKLSFCCPPGKQSKGCYGNARATDVLLVPTTSYVIVIDTKKDEQ